jgi:hypothetical protein
VSQLKDKIVGDKSQRDQKCRDALLSLFSSFPHKLAEFIEHLKDSIQESLRPEVVLAGKKILHQDGSKLNKAVSQQKEFTEDAIAVRTPDKKERQFDIRIVNGPSGSGKTVYSVNYLAFLDDAGDGKDDAGDGKDDAGDGKEVVWGSCSSR